MQMTPFIIYVDVDDTLVRSVGTKRIPIPRVIAEVRELRAAGATLFLWSSGGAEYARATAVELGLSDCFESYLPKPMIVLDDQSILEWRGFSQVHPNEGVAGILERLRARSAPPNP